MVVVLLTCDLMVTSRVEGAAARAGAAVFSAADARRIVELCAANEVTLVIIDLATPALEIETLVEALRAEPGAEPRTLAFGPHVHAARLAAARQAGCDDVLSRGEFFARLEEHLARLT